MIQPSLEYDNTNLNFLNKIFKIVKYEESLFINDPWTRNILSILYNIDDKANWSLSTRPVASQFKQGSL